MTSHHHDDLFPSDAEGMPFYVIVERRGNLGLLAGLRGCALAVLAIFTLAFVFVPLAVLRTTIVGLLQDATDGPNRQRQSEQSSEEDSIAHMIERPAPPAWNKRSGKRFRRRLACPAAKEQITKQG
jgi:hypothetical protein